MSILHNQLALFGAIDDLVVEAKRGRTESDRAIVRMVERFLPRSTGMCQDGWYRELERFLSQQAVAHDTGLTFPTTEHAIAGLAEVPTARDTPLEEPSDPSHGFEDTLPYSPANDPVLARAGYAAMVLGKIYAAKNAGAPDGLYDVMRTAVSSFSYRLTEERGFGEPDTRISDEIARDLYEASGVETRAQWFDYVAQQPRFNDIEAERGAQFAQTSTPCFGSVLQNDGKYCSLVTSDFTASEVSVKHIERIINPINWKLCSKFYCSMEKNDPNRNSGSWSRVNEQVSAEPEKYHLAVDLLFYKARQSSGAIFINYDMDPVQADTCLVEVDNGYIWVTPNNATDDASAPGVRIRTSKQERIKGVSASAMAALACLLGWNDAGRDMLAGTARRVIDGSKNAAQFKVFIPSSEHDPEEKDSA
jgi:hypothetical protein